MFSLKKIKIAFYLSSTKASVHQRSKAQSFLQTTQKAKKKKRAQERWQATHDEKAEVINELTVGVEGCGDEVGAGTERGGQRQREGEIPVADEQNALSRGVMLHPLHPFLSCCRLLHPSKAATSNGAFWTVVCACVFSAGFRVQRSRAAGLLMPV